jgi:hypothetical protein
MLGYCMAANVTDYRSFSLHTGACVLDEKTMLIDWDSPGTAQQTFQQRVQTLPLIDLLDVGLFCGAAYRSVALPVLTLASLSTCRLEPALLLGRPEVCRLACDCSSVSQHSFLRTVSTSSAVQLSSTCMVASFESNLYRRVVERVACTHLVAVKTSSVGQMQYRPRLLHA